jgi:hypothetical protein
VSRRRPSLALGIVAFAWLAASCATPSPGGTRVVAFDEEGLRLSLPAGWAAMRSNEAGFRHGRLLFYLSNQSLHADCAAVDHGLACPLPVDALDQRGVLVLWATSSCAGPACELPDGDRRLVSGREAAAGAPTGMCEPIGATEEQVYAVTVTPQRVDWIVICARSPESEERAALVSILDGVDWRTP